MGNCLVTKLKAVVDNDNLEKLGELSMLVKSSEMSGIGEYVIFSASPEQGFSLIAEDGKLIWDSNNQSYTEYPIVANGTDVQMFFKNLDNADYKVYMKEKYNVAKIDLFNAHIYIDFSNIGVGCNLEYIRMKPGYIKGNLDGIKNLSRLKFFYCDSQPNLYADINVFAGLSLLEEVYASASPNIVGNIRSLGNCVNLKAFDLHDTGVNGSIEDFVSAQIVAGRTATATPIQATQALRYLTFGGTTHAEDVWVHFIEWTSANKINVYCSNDTLENFTKVYAKGATAEEITAWESAGKTVVIVS